MSLVRFRPEAPYADLAHLVERHLAKVEVAGSSPVIRSKKIQVCDLDFFYPSRRLGIDARRLANPSLRSLHHALACISSALWAVYHHRRCILLRLDDILARKRDILVFGRMICNFCEIDDIQCCALMISSHFVTDDIHFLRK